nr:ParA family protein [Pseudonocardia sp. ICBG601]
MQPHQLESTVYNLLMEARRRGRRGAPGHRRGEPRPAAVEHRPVGGRGPARHRSRPGAGPRPRPQARFLPDYDIVLIDCQPSLGLLTINALACADEVLIPLACEFFSLRGVALLMDTIDKVTERLNPDLRLLGVLPTMFDTRTLHTREVHDRVVEAFGEKVFDAVINRTIKFPETTVAGEPITTWAPTSYAAEAYRMLAREVIAR